jgi:uncharacterized membrane protein YgdD (TMEM256/DUF423 family)
MTSNKNQPPAAKTLLAINTVLAGCAVLLGAFAAHGLKQHLSSDAIHIFQTGVRYMMWHSIAGLCFGLFCYHQPTQLPQPQWPGIFFIVGICLFSGSLFALSLTSVSWFGAITPLGGLCFVAGWIGFLLNILKTP